MRGDLNSPLPEPRTLSSPLRDRQTQGSLSGAEPVKGNSVPTTQGHWPCGGAGDGLAAQEEAGLLVSIF